MTYDWGAMAVSVLNAVMVRDIMFRDEVTVASEVLELEGS